MKINLKVKIASLVVILIFIIMLAVSYITIIQVREAKEEETSRRAKAIAKMIANVKLTSLVSGVALDPKIMDSFVAVAKGLDDNIAYITVVDENNRLLAGEINPRFVQMDERRGKRATLEYLAQEGKGIGEGLKAIAIDLGIGTYPKGKVKVGFTLRKMEEEIAYARNRNIIITALFILLGMAGSITLAGNITRPIRKIVSAMNKVSEGDLSQKVEVKSRDEIGTLANTFNFMTEGLREREWIKDTFARYVSKQVAHKILKEKDRLILKGELRRVTILFADIREFTSLAERMKPEEVVSLLNECFDVLIDTIFKYEGTLDKFVGDAVMAVYGAPLEQDEPELKAVKTGLEMQEALYRLNQRRKEEGKPPINIGIGINTGEVVAGNIGSEKRMEYTVVGREVNLAQRIETRTERGQVLISESTYQAVKDRIEAIKLEPIRMKGVGEPVQLYQVTGLKGEAT